MKTFNPFLAVGKEAITDQFWVDADGDARPIYAKILETGALPNNTSKNVAHEIDDVDPEGFFDCVHLHATNGTEVLSKTQVGLTVKMTATNVVISTSTNLSTYSGEVMIAYVKIKES